MEKSSRVDAYIINKVDQNLLGEGSFGTVYKIIRKLDGLECAAKFIKKPVHFMEPND
jgi:hypothetical protein